MPRDLRFFQLFAELKTGAVVGDKLSAFYSSEADLGSKLRLDVALQLLV